MKWRILRLVLALAALNSHQARQNESSSCNKIAPTADMKQTPVTLCSNKLTNTDDYTSTQPTTTVTKGMDQIHTTTTVQTSPKIVTNEKQSSTTTMLDTSPSISDTSMNCEMAITALGIVVGLLVMVLVIVLTGWGWTCWLLKRRIHSERRVYSTHNPTYMQRISLESNSEQLSQQTITNCTSNHYCHRLEEVKEAGDLESQEENVYHILENPAGDDVYEVLDKYEQEEPQDQEEENVYHIAVDGPTVVTEEEEEPEGVATPPSSDITVTVEDYKVAILQTST